MKLIVMIIIIKIKMFNVVIKGTHCSNGRLLVILHDVCMITGRGLGNSLHAF